MNLLISGVVTVFSISLVLPCHGQIHFSHQGTHGSNHSNQAGARKSGVCTFEVSTSDLIAPEDRVAGVPRGNGSRADLTKIHICCQGYERIPHPYQSPYLHCQPICDRGCENGNCTAPNVCTCKRGFIKTAENPDKCIPTCPIGCANGDCTRGSCECHFGFSRSSNGKYCVPRCTGGCGQGGRCTDPETCTCSPGYEVNRDTNKCEYYCQGGCGGHGTCVGPNQCSCRAGYKSVAGGSCDPDCPRGCKNGVCLAPNICRCEPGWSADRSGTECIPHCSSSCSNDNAECVAPETCACKKGYTLAVDGDARKCKPFCPGGCENGRCSSPNYCRCNSGFTKESSGSNRCIRPLPNY